MAACEHSHFLPLLLPLVAHLAAAVTLSSHLASLPSDCYERVAIGQRLASSQGTRSAPAQTDKDCEKLCDEDLDQCGAFSFQLDGKGGNGTCQLAKALPPRSALEEHPDSDVFVKKEECRFTKVPPPAYKPRPQQPPDYRACYRRLAAGRRLPEHLVRRSLPALTVEDCQRACSNERHFTCEGFNFRLDVAGFGRSVCELGATPSGQLDVGFDLYPDPDYDYYEWDRGNSADCRAGPPASQQRWPEQRPYGGSWGGYQPAWRPAWRPQPAPGAVGFQQPRPPQLRPPQQHRPPPAQDCFLRYRSGFRLDRMAVRSSLSTSSVHECEAVCGNQKHFVCNTFSYRYSLEPSFPRDNCQLSERLFRDLDAYTDLLPDRDYDIYVRNEHSGACGLPVAPHRPPVRGDIECFVRVRTGQWLDHAVVKETLSVSTVVDCEIECLRSRFFTCRLFAYRYGSAVIGGLPHNCQLSDWPFSELDPRRDVLEDLEYELYERGSYGHGCELDRPLPHLPYQPPAAPGNAQCYASYGAPARLLPSAVKSSLNVPSEDDCRTECTRTRDSFMFYCAAFSFQGRKNHHHSFGHNCLLTDVDQRDLRPGLDYVHEDGHWLFAWDSRNPRCSPHPHSHHQPSGGHLSHLSSTALAVPEPGPGDAWQKFTVSGRPCRHGTFCTENHVAGFWSCELEGGDAGSFDYCCRPGHHCGYSEGYNYPWCYVGSANRDQWRPCSDQYFPYHERRPGPIHQEDYGPPRHWPVAYLHTEGPPNTSMDYPRRVSPQFDDRENYIGLDTYRYSYGKKLEAYLPGNRSEPYRQVIEHKQDESPMFEVVEDEMVDANGTSDVAPTPTAMIQMTRLQPRLAQAVDKMAKGPARMWSWRETDLEGKPTGRVILRRRVRPGPIFLTATKPVPVSVTKV